MVGGEFDKSGKRRRSLSDAIVENYKTGALPHTSTATGTALAVYDEGILVDANVNRLNFVGAGVTASQAATGEVDVTIPGSGAATIRRGTTVQRNALVLSAISDNGHPFYDTDLDLFMQWWEGTWYAVTVTPETSSVDQPVVWWGTQAEILPQTYKSGDRWIDTTGGKNTVRICLAVVITNAIADWRAVGTQNNAP